MSQPYLIEMSLGPVQGFIEAASRTSDLWQGSRILGQLAFELTSYLKANGCELIYPSPRAFDEVSKPTSQVNITNIVLVKVSLASDEQANRLLEQTKVTLYSKLNQMCADAVLPYSKYLVPNVDELLADFAKHNLEYFAVWARYGDDPYRTVYDRLKLELAGRKMTRAFHQLTGHHGLPKSSLDGVMNTVLNPNLSQKDKILFSKIARLRQGEQLDLMGMMKRLGQGREQFTPLSRIAANSWIKLLDAKNPDLLRAIGDEYEKLVALKVATRVLGNGDVYSCFPYDAQYLFESRLLELRTQFVQEDGEVPAVILKLEDLVQRGRELVGGIDPYMVMMSGDGDRVGRLFDAAVTSDQHQAFSDALFDFSKTVRPIMKSYDGHAIYAGGDDLLGLLPIERALDCAEQLCESFSSTLQSQSSALGFMPPTLSIGLAIVHCLEPLGQVRQIAMRSLKLAKGDAAKLPAPEQRNAIGIVLNIRSGRPVEVRLRRTIEAEPFLEPRAQFRELIAGFSRLGADGDSMASRLAFAPLEIFRQFSKSNGNSQEFATKRMMKLELARVLERTQNLSPKFKGLVWRAIEVHGWESFSDWMVAARWLSRRKANTTEVN